MVGKVRVRSQGELCTEKSTSRIASNEAERKHGLASNPTIERVRRWHSGGCRHRTWLKAARERGRRRPRGARAGTPSIGARTGASIVGRGSYHIYSRLLNKIQLKTWTQTACSVTHTPAPSWRPSRRCGCLIPLQTHVIMCDNR